ncbi:unnamed protein product [Pieris brassicae]|uniref:Uncharacterized protein n=1 Tax=Pieris brassicae TaxID=7116 RepID=A0A9P0XER6_PIEBR|nr:unnamed protein product [Pieris brassicae]
MALVVVGLRRAVTRDGAARRNCARLLSGRRSARMAAGASGMHSIIRKTKRGSNNGKKRNTQIIVRNEAAGSGGGRAVRRGPAVALARRTQTARAPAPFASDSA